MKERVFVGLSGGVDSSVAALRLLRDGYDVVGVFIKVWQPPFIHCDWEKERLDAMRVAAHLGIPFLTCDAEEAYKKHVADYMVEEYRRGRTPNPDVMCNEFVKFGAFYAWARAHGADLIATGHYAQKKIVGERHTLHTALDTAKDQTYFLAHITQDALNHSLFPIGNTLKSDVRKEAEKNGLPTFKKADSQGICFLGQIDIKEFLSHYITLTQGEVLDMSGNVIGEHDGALIYTIGQRHGFRIRAKGESRPHFVHARDLRHNTITVSPLAPVMESTTAIPIHMLASMGNGHSGNERYDAVFRYHGPRIPIRLGVTRDGNGILTPEVDTLQQPTGGQLCALYRGTECVGSAFIT
jgi:tRNA-uridine 2-sulfurtransferase